jgi:F-type H+-transporting ATPase subunit b
VNINLTLIGQSIAFLAFVWFCMKYVWPPVIGAMRERQERIAAGLRDAERASKDLELAQDRSVEALREAKAQAAELIEQANKRANQMIEEAKQLAREEGERLKTAAQAEIEQEINRARESLRSQVAVLSLAGAEKILGVSVDHKAHADMLDKLAAEL